MPPGVRAVVERPRIPSESQVEHQLRVRRRQRERVPAEHQQIELHRMSPVELLRAPKDVAVGIALDAAVQELVSGREAIEQARPAAAGAEHDGIAPDHGQIARAVDRVALQPGLVRLE